MISASMDLKVSYSGISGIDNLQPQTEIYMASNAHIFLNGFPAKIHHKIRGGSSVSQNKLPQLILGYIYILKYLQSNFIG